MKLNITKHFPYEIIHFAENDFIVASKSNNIYICKNNKETLKIKIPQHWILTLLSVFRLSRRALRLDKINVFWQPDYLVIIRRGIVYRYDLQTNELVKTLTLKNCRNVLHQSINIDKEGSIYFGEYGANPQRKEVPVYKSSDKGFTWKEIYNFPSGKIKHIHGCYYDKYTDRIWVCTGDFEGENYLLVADKNFETIEYIGDGTQPYRACNLIFKEQEVHWLMDSQLEPSYHIIFDRKTKTIIKNQKLLGPIWYIKELEDEVYVSATAQEIGAGVLDAYVNLYVSTDLKQWNVLQKFEHDKLPKRYFKFGVIGFADGKQTLDNFYMFFEAVKKYDGKSIKCSILK